MIKNDSIRNNGNIKIKPEDFYVKMILSITKKLPEKLYPIFRIIILLKDKVYRGPYLRLIKL